MGIQDRPYYRDDDQMSWFGGRPLIIQLIVANVAVYVLQLLAKPEFTDALSLQGNLLREPWHAYQLLTYGFLHHRGNISHILFNMIGLWVFGTALEQIYSRAELLRIYLVTLVVAGLAWVIFETATAQPVLLDEYKLLGASGGVMGLMAIYVFNFPKRVLYLMGILPLPGWALGALYLFWDLLPVGNNDGVGHMAHLAGMAFGAIYYQTGLNFGRILPQRWSWSSFRLRPRLKIHSPEDESRDLNQQVDEILEKIHQQGEASLTKKERRTLEEASRRYQRRRQ